MQKDYQNLSPLSTLQPNGKIKKTPVYVLPTCAALLADLFHTCPSSCMECSASGGAKC